MGSSVRLKIPISFVLFRCLSSRRRKASPRGVNYGALCESLSNDKVYNTVNPRNRQEESLSKFMILTRRAEHGNLLKGSFFNSNGIPADTFLRATEVLCQL